MVLLSVPEMSSKKVETMTSYYGYIIIEGYRMVNQFSLPSLMCKNNYYYWQYMCLLHNIIYSILVTVVFSYTYIYVSR